MLENVISYHMMCATIVQASKDGRGELMLRTHENEDFVFDDTFE